MIIDKYKLIAFDLDGTLVHTVAEHRYFLVPQVLKKLGIQKRVSQKIIDKFWFDGDREKTIKKYFKLDQKTFWDKFHKMDKIEERAKYTRAYDDSVEVLKQLRKRGKLLAITTGAPKKIAKLELSKLPDRIFERVISITSTRYKGKPDPLSLKAILKFCKVKTSDAVYIGNSNEDAQYAKNAEVDFIYLERREHQFSGKHIVTISSLRELI